MEARKQPAPDGLAIATFGFNCHLNVGDGLAAREQIAHPAERFEHFVLGGERMLRWVRILMPDLDTLAFRPRRHGSFE